MLCGVQERNSIFRIKIERKVTISEKTLFLNKNREKYSYLHVKDPFLTLEILIKVLYIICYGLGCICCDLGLTLFVLTREKGIVTLYFISFIYFKLYFLFTFTQQRVYF